MLFHENDSAEYARAIFEAESCRVSAPTFVELSMVLESVSGDSGIRQCDEFFRGAGIIIEPFTERQAHIARQAFSDYGKGRSPARLNLGDCFSYALAKSMAEPLLFKGNDFRKTDIEPVISS